MPKIKKLAVTVGVLFLLSVGAIWWIKKSGPQAGMACDDTGKIVVAHDGSLLICQKAAGWKPTSK